jgi:hypothetical protein
VLFPFVPPITTIGAEMNREANSISEITSRPDFSNATSAGKFGTPGDTTAICADSHGTLS